MAASAASAAAIATVKTAAPAAVSPSDAPSPPRANRRGDGSMQKPRQSLMIDEQLKLIEMKESGAYRTWAEIKEAFSISVSEAAI